MGSCATARVSKGNTFTLAETDGALHITVHSALNAVDQIYDGGINHGGDFRVGSNYPSGDNVSRGLLSGTVVAGVSIDAESLIIADLSDQERAAAERNAATVYPDLQFDPFPVVNPLEFRQPGHAYWEAAGGGPEPPSARLLGGEDAAPEEPWETGTLHDVLERIGGYTRDPNKRAAQARPDLSR